MYGFLSALIIILILGILITVHELGHYIAARLSGIRVREFAIGMGPAFFRRQKKNAGGEPEGTIFSLRAFPIGGFCDMGEDEANDDAAHFRNKSIWKRMFVLIAGSAMNFLIGFVFFFILYLSMPFQPMPDIHSLDPAFPYAGQIQPGDRFLSINGHRLYNSEDFHLFLDRDRDKPYTFVMSRNGQTFTVEGAERTIRRQVMNADGTPRLDENGNEIFTYVFGFNIGGLEELTFANSVKHAAMSTVSFVRLVWITVGDLFSSNAGMGEIVGPVGLGDVINQIISDERARIGVVMQFLLRMAGLVAVNLAVVNLLPIPALDGGRIIFLFISAFLVKVRGKPLNANVESYIHGITMLLLFALMIFIFYNDIMRLIGRIFGS